ncbi:MAG: prlF antitoxin for toxin YhaV toxin [Acidobacteriota bacterium]|jgi:AbrB family looped-hinge helix DNA binding protein|nr:prlF antitoxin for toxin YhaV toxin [Acidobacteriota bacterium]
MSASTLTSKGQVTIPKEVRERLGLKEGDRLVFRFDDEGNLLFGRRPEALWVDSPVFCTILLESGRSPSRR